MLLIIFYGFNQYGQDGIKNIRHMNLLTKIDNLKIKKVSCVFYCTAVINVDGYIWDCVYNTSEKQHIFVKINDNQKFIDVYYGETLYALDEYYYLWGYGNNKNI